MPQSSTAAVAPQSYISEHLLRVFAVPSSTVPVEMLVWPHCQSLGTAPGTILQMEFVLLVTTLWTCSFGGSMSLLLHPVVESSHSVKAMLVLRNRTLVNINKSFGPLLQGYLTGNVKLH